MEFHTTVGLFRFAGICVGEVGEVNKVSCTHGCSDHCHRLQHGQVIGMDVSSNILNIQFNMACYRTMAQAGKAREGREDPQKHGQAGLMDATLHTWASIGNKATCVCLHPHHM